MRTAEFDIIFLSYDEPNADQHYADLCNKVPWAKRIHGIKGSDAAHKAAARASDTEWFITVDGDNIVDLKFFSLDIDMSKTEIQAYGWCGRNRINGLRYGNGGLKIWRKDFVLNMKTHEESTSDRAQVDFCWENGYKNFPKVYSESIINGSEFQAWRAGFREGVKMTLLDGVRIPVDEIKQRIWWHNLHRLKIWSTVGAHEEHGLYAIHGARLGQWMANCSAWNYVDVRDFEILKNIYNENVNHDNLEHDIQDLGYRIKKDMGFDYPYLNAQQSKYTLDIYDEAIDLGLTYYAVVENV
jgi:hypothetical protein